MNLTSFGKKNPHLYHLLNQAEHWQKLDYHLKQMLPPLLQNHCQVACVRDGCLIILAHNNMAASRLRMVLPTLLAQLQAIDANIVSTRVKVQLLETSKPVIKHAVLSTVARRALADSAEAVSHHPELAQALRRLSKKND